MFTYVYFIFRIEIINKSGSVYAKTKRRKQKQKQSYNERKKNSKAGNKATQEKSNSKWDVYKRNLREKKKIETIGNAIFILMCFSFFFLGRKFGKQIFRSLNSLFRNKQCISKKFL